MQTIQDVLRDEIGKAESLNSVATGAGVAYSGLYLFYHEGIDIRLSTVQALADYFGYELKKKRKRKV